MIEEEEKEKFLKKVGLKKRIDRDAYYSEFIQLSCQFIKNMSLEDIKLEYNRCNN